VKQLKAYAKSIGSPIGTGWIHTLSFLDKSDYEPRVRYATTMLALLRANPDALHRIVFEDETSISRTPGPDGKPHDMQHCVLLQSTNQPAYQSLARLAWLTWLNTNCHAVL
jgi:hypothetical protein